MWGTIVNSAAIVAGTCVGLLAKKSIPERLNSAIMNGLALAVVMLGIRGLFDGENMLVAIVSIVIGTVVGSLIDLDKQVRRLGDKVQSRFKNAKSPVSEAFVVSSVLFCTGAMAVMGCMNSGIEGDHTILYTKSLIDLVTSVMFAATLGFGVVFSALAVLLYQGLLTVLAMVASPLLTETVANEMGCIGSILLVGLGLNMLKVTDLKIMNHLPSIFVPILIYLFI